MADEKAKPVITIAQIKQDLKDGIERYPNKKDPSQPSIQEKYGLRRVDVVKLFTNEELKGLKVHRARGASSKSKATIGFILQDESGNDITSTVFPAASTSSTSTDNAVAPTVESAPVTEAQPAEAEASW